MWLRFVVWPDGVRGEETEPPVASCRCHFFDGCGDLQQQPPPGGGEHWVDEVLRRRFLRLGTVSESAIEIKLIGLYAISFPFEFEHFCSVISTATARWKEKRRRLDRSLPVTSLMGRCTVMF
jgi:hypothetical protein